MILLQTIASLQRLQEFLVEFWLLLSILIGSENAEKSSQSALIPSLSLSLTKTFAITLSDMFNFFNPQL
jgi:hypothetical protein